MKPRRREVFGALFLYDGTFIDLQGQTLAEAKTQVAGRGIRTHQVDKTHYSEDHVLVTHPTQALYSVVEVRKLFRKE